MELKLREKTRKVGDRIKGGQGGGQKTRENEWLGKEREGETNKTTEHYRVQSKNFQYKLS